MKNFLHIRWRLSCRNLTATLALFLSAFLFANVTAFGADPIRIEAEASQGVALNGVQIVHDQPGYSGSGYAWGFDDDSNGGDNIVFTFSAPAGNYQLTIGYYSPYGDKKTRVTVNGATSEQDLKGTSTNFSATTVGTYQLLNGQNTVIINKDWGYYGIDYIVLTPASVKPPTVVPLVNGRAEAEAGDLTGVNVATTNPGFSGTGYVTGFDDATDQITLTFNGTAGLYDLSIGYASPYGDKGVDFQVNDEKGSGTLKQTMTGYSTSNVGKFLLTTGLNTITIYRGWGYFDIDYIQLTPATAPLPIKPPKILVDAQATPSTRGLFSYMVDQYGSKVLSGQQDDVEYILDKTGKEPAIGSFDLIDYSPSRVQYGSTPVRSSEDIIKWAKKGEGRGIISLMWHWNAPTDLINQAPDKLWWRGFYTEATTFDLAAVLADKHGAKYQLLLRDIDAIAVQLKKFQAADVPVLWRPLHEAPGGWFWWGAKGSGPFKELWQILYNRLTNYHQLHNLIWVFSGTDTINPDWYPGDQYVDVVGEDIYADPTANMSGNWANAQSQFNGKKLVTLSETGNLPNPDKIRGFATWWSWFSVWTGDDYIKKQSIDLLKKVYTDQDIITRDELPDWRPATTLSVMYQDGDGQPNNEWIKPNLNLVNDGSTPVPYSELTVRYWLTPENFSGINTWVDWAQVGAGFVKSKYVTLDQPRDGAFGYVEYSFDPAAGSLASNTNSGPIQSRLANQGWGSLSESGDYSYQSGGNYTANNRITLYRNGQLIWGIEPQTAPMQQAVKVYTSNQNYYPYTNVVSTYVMLANTGNVPLNYDDLSVRYWFSTEGNTAMNFWIDWAQMGASNLIGQVVQNQNRQGANAYVELKVKPSMGQLNPMANTGDIRFRAAKVDWTPFDETNDFSYKPAGSYVENDHVTVYYKGQLIYGTEPANLGSARIFAEAHAPSLRAALLGNPVVSDQADVEIRGVEGKALSMKILDLKGNVVVEKKVEQAAEVERHSLRIGSTPGAYLLQVRAADESTTLKILKP